MTSVIIVAYNEASIIGQNLDLLLSGTSRDDMEVIVVANGCVDATAAVARARGVRVLDLPDPGKSAALNAGDAVATSFPRVYLDADIAVSSAMVRALADALSRPDAGTGTVPLAAAPDRHLVVRGRPLAVRCYFAIQSRLPAARSGLYGRGMIALSERGRARFARFPDILADDLFLDSLFAESERVILTSVRTEVQTPRSTRDLVLRLTRVRRGNAELRALSGQGGVHEVRRSSRISWLRHVVLRQPWLLPAGVPYAVITVLADLRARRVGDRWERDSSTRRPDDAGPGR
ncbi:glycosyltransferase family 2 protein [Cellulomonas fimi]|uniref:4,4'-diaponeurosporenoate glycosyltransferase n=1 Tax=Cellulomonas fimi TaxID=1708 RepID=A0A7Y0M080_CELFI|nr:glycosyltransferase [Cellulomonas fimi]NMR21443.1 glycosyltransferase [Cellulomonas fimi]